MPQKALSPLACFPRVVFQDRSSETGLPRPAFEDRAPKTGLLFSETGLPRLFFHNYWPLDLQYFIDQNSSSRPGAHPCAHPCATLARPVFHRGVLVHILARNPGLARHLVHPCAILAPSLRARVFTNVSLRAPLRRTLFDKQFLDIMFYNKI